MALPEIVSREEWLEARRRLLEREKEETRRLVALNAERRRLPMVRVEKKYLFDGPEGPVTLADLFGDRSQLIVQHVMFDPGWDAACPGCTADIDVINGRLLTQLGSRDTAFALVSLAPLAKLEAYRSARGWWCRGTPRRAATSTTTSRSPWTRTRARCTTTTATSPQI
jgi:predicted dithiol-disulfide oxidoreductase (DUF899 family)